MKKLIILSFAATTLFSLTSCRKKLDTIAHIYVKDETNASVTNAMVVLYGTNTQSTPQQVAVYDTAYTNANGLASFNASLKLSQSWSMKKPSTFNRN